MISSEILSSYPPSRNNTKKAGTKNVAAPWQRDSHRISGHLNDLKGIWPFGGVAKPYLEPCIISRRVYVTPIL